MPDYRFRAVDRAGAMVSGSLHAADLPALESALGTRGLTPVSVRRQLGRHKRGMGRDQRLLWLQQLQVLLAAGLPLFDALEHLGRGGGELARCSRALASSLSAGLPLSSAMREQAGDFDAACCALVRVGESTGDLAGSLSALADVQVWWFDLRRRLRRAVTYPLMTFALLLIVVPLVMVVLVPQLRSLIALIGGELPWYTRALLASSAWLQQHLGWLTLSSLALGLAASRLVAPGRPLGLVWARICLWVPLIGTLNLCAQLAMLCQQLAAMYRAGLAVDEMLSLSSASVDNLQLRYDLAEAHRAVLSGQALSAALGRTCVPPLLLQLIQTGELSGRLEHTLEHAAKLYSGEADRHAARLAALVGPMLLLLVAALVGWLVAALLLPLYDSLFALGGSW